MRPVFGLAALCLVLLGSQIVRAENFACDFTGSMGFCYEYDGNDWKSELENTKKACEMVTGGVFLDGSCPDQDVVGVCDFDIEEAPGKVIRYYYYEPEFTERTARLSCPGEFSLP